MTLLQDISWKGGLKPVYSKIIFGRVGHEVWPILFYFHFLKGWAGEGKIKF
jgi:hypothetical protein